MCYVITISLLKLTEVQNTSCQLWSHKDVLQHDQVHSETSPYINPATTRPELKITYCTITINSVLFTFYAPLTCAQSQEQRPKLFKAPTSKYSVANARQPLNIIIRISCSCL